MPSCFAAVCPTTNPEYILISTSLLHESSFMTVHQDVKHDETAVLSLREALLNTDRNDAGNGRILNVESNAQDTVDTEVTTQNNTPAMTQTGI